MARVVLLTAHTRDGEVQHRYVADRILAEFGDELQAVIVATGVKRSAGEKAARWLKRYSARQIVSRLVLRLTHLASGERQRRQRTFRQVLFPEGENGTMPGPVIEVAAHNSAECRALIAELRPDAVVVYGTLVIGKKLIAACPVIVNLHTGLSPRYRGSDTIFWPLHNGEPQHLGVTVHRIDAGIDSGPILARGRPAIALDDDEHTLFAKGVKLGAELLCRATRRELEGTARPISQTLADGHEYRSVDRTAAAERRCRRNLRQGLLAKGQDPWLEEF